MATTVTPKRKPRKKSVLKRIRQTERHTEVNRANRSRLRTQLKKLRQALATGNLEQARQQLSPTLSLLDRSSRKGIIHSNRAARTKSRLLLRYNALLHHSPAAPASA